MNVTELLAELIDKNVNLSVVDGELGIKAARGVITPELKERLSAHKEDLIVTLQEIAGNQTPLEKIHRNGPLPLSYAQQRLWFVNQFEGGASTNYNMTGAYRLAGELNVAAIRKAIQKIVQRHESLRTRFLMVDDQAVQEINDDLNIEVPVIEVTEKEVESYVDSYAAHVFDLSRGPLIKIGLLRLSNEEHVFLLNMHHIISDGWSYDVFNRELEVLYVAYSNGEPPQLPPLPIQYVDYAHWQRQGPQKAKLEQQVNYWERQLENAPALLELPTDRPRPAAQSYRGAKEKITIPKALADQLNDLSQQENATLFMVLVAAFQVLLARYSGQNDICVGTPIANRQRMELEGLIGFFINTLVLRSRIDSQDSFKDLIQQIKEISLSAYAHQDAPFEHVVEILQPERSISYAPLFQVMFGLQSASENNLTLPAIAVVPLESETHTTRLDLTVSLTESEKGIEGLLEYSTDLFDKSTIKRIACHYLNLLEGVVNDPAQRLCELPLLSEEENRHILYDWNDTQIDYPRDKCIHQLFEEQVNNSPDAIAVVYEDQQLTYAELNQRSNQLAHYLVEQGVGLEVKVGLCLERSLEMMIGILGILKTGAAYVPIDPDYPQQRIEYLVSDSGIPFLLTQSDLLDTILNDPARVVLCLDQDWPAIALSSTDNLVVGVSPYNLAYMIYTSGSTGQPKGVMLQHASISNHILWRQRTFAFTHKDVVLQKTPLSFDVSVFEWALALLIGAKLILARSGGHREPDYLLELIDKHQITTTQVVPALLSFLVGDKAKEKMQSFQCLFSGGEALSHGLCNKFKEMDLAGALCNVYGPTEAAIDTAYWCYDPVPNVEIAPIGKPIDNSKIHILDSYLNPVPIGVVGELYIGGEGLARGYYNKSVLTAEKFLPDPFSTDLGCRLYKSGDLVRYLADGNIEFIGRTDHQVKVRGFRIELGEIEAVILDKSGIMQCVVLVQTNGREATDKYIVAYIVTDAGVEINQDELRQLLISQLPDYMVPTFFVFLNELPLTPNGKIDRKALPLADVGLLQEREYIAPSTETEKALTEIWSEVLDLGPAQIGIHSNFFELGGHSLLATRVASQIRKTFNVEIQIKDLFVANIIEALAIVIDDVINCNQLIDESAFPLKPIERKGVLPLSYAQQRLWFIDQFEGGTGIHYNVPWPLRLKGDLNVSALQKAFDAIIQRHETLRTTFTSRGGKAVQKIANVLHIDFPIIDVTEEQVADYLSSYATHIFDLSAGPLVKAALLRLSDKEYVLLINMHHIISDGWSLGVLGQELADLYLAYCDRIDSPLIPLPIQYVDYADWQRKWLKGEVMEQQISYWKEQLQGAPALLELPTDRTRPAIQRFEGTYYPFTFPIELTRQLEQLSQKEGVTLFMLLLAGFNVVLARYSGQNDICIGTPIANRQRAELEGLIGFFVNTLVMRNKINCATDFKDFLQQVKETALSAYAHQDLPFEHLVGTLNPERSMSYMPLFQIMFAMQNDSDVTIKLPNITTSLEDCGTHTARTDLTMSIRASSECIEGAVEYSTNLFDQDTIQRMIEHYQVLLEGIVANPGQKIYELPMLSKAERHQILYDWNNTRAAYSQDKCIHQLFEAQAERIPSAIAVIYENQKLSYGELNRKSSQLACYLIDQGIGPEVRVGLCLQRSMEMIIGILGILKAGAAYVPIDPDYPEQRLEYILNDSAVMAVLTQRELAGKFTTTTNALLICLDDTNIFCLQERYSDKCLESSRADLYPSNLAYVIYTSGSTGKPKGTLLNHQGMVNLSMAQRNLFAVGGDSRVIQFASVGFDAATWEWVMALTNGAQLCLVSTDVAKSGEEFAKWMCRYLITHAILPPALLPQLDSTQFPDLTHLMVGGEACTEELAREWHQGRNFFNAYGPTETTVCASIYHYTKASQRLSIGHPLPNFCLYVLDEYQNPVPVGVLGELYISSVGLARGYFNRSGLTAEKFIPDLFGNVPGGRLYRSGDLVRFLPDGNIDFVGRIDHQVKVRGFRIELGEIESVLAGQHCIQEVVVLALTRSQTSRDKYLVAYIVSDADAGQDSDQLYRALQRELPNYMMPSYFVFLDELPLTSNGKVDRKALPTPDTSKLLTQEYVAPRTETEKGLVKIWADVLDIPVDKIGINDNFFQLGGHSLLVVSVVSCIRVTFNTEIKIRDLFEAKTLKAFALIVDETIKNQSGEVDDISPLIPEKREIPMLLSYTQQRMWFINKFHGKEDISHNIPLAFRLKGSLNIEALIKTFQTIIQRQESLRTSFKSVDGIPEQLITNKLPFDIPVIHVDEKDVSVYIHKHASQAFDLLESPLIKISLLRLSLEEHVLLLNMHHIISDGWSISVLNSELSEIYSAYIKGETSPLPPLHVQYVDFALWQQRRLQKNELERQIRYWKEQLRGAPESLALPTDYPRPEVQSHIGDSYYFTLPTRVAEGLHSLCRQENVTLFMLLITVFNILLHRYGGQNDICVGSVVANRRRREFEKVIGYFANLILLRFQYTGNPTFRDLLSQAKITTLSAFENQDVPFEYLAEVLKHGRSLSHTSLFQVSFALQNAHQRAFTLPNITISPEAINTYTAKFDLSMSFTNSDGKLIGGWEYNTDLFDRSTIRRLSDYYQNLLESIIANPDERLYDLQMQPESEHRQLPGERNNNNAPILQDKCISDEFEFKLIEVWETLLGCGNIHIHDNFFDLGGHSMLALQLLERIRIEFGQVMPLVVLFEKPTISCLATELRRARSGGGIQLPQ